MQALQPEDGVAPVLLIDELDRTDEPFEAYLLEVLAEYSGDDPRAWRDPRRVASHRHHHLQPHARDSRRDQAALPVSLGRFSDAERELAIVRRKVPGVDARPLSREVVAFTQRLRAMDLFKVAGDRRDA